MIVKNEETLLGRALANWRALADELIVVDTGSSDATPAIAEAAGARLLRYDWQPPGHKGAARNVGLDAATGDWIVVLDADEVIDDPAGLRAWLQNPPEPHVTAVNVLFENYAQDGVTPTLRWYQVRVFRRGLYRYSYREHEVPRWCGEGEESEFALQTLFRHLPPPDRMPAKAGPMLERLRLDVAEQPDDPHPAYFLHRQYALSGLWQEAIEAGHHYLAIAGANDRCECYGNMAICHEQRGEMEEARRWLYQAAAAQPGRRSWWVRLARTYIAQQQWNLALAHLRLASELWPAPLWQAGPDDSAQTLQAEIDYCHVHVAAQQHTH